jgi:hypothetical protein
MALEKTFNQLQEQINQLHEGIHHLSFAADAPHPEPNELADNLRDRTFKLVGLSLGAIEHAANCRQSATPPGDIAQLGQELVGVHLGVNDIAEVFWMGVASREITSELITLARRKDEDWRGWTLGVGQAVERCQAPLVNVMDGLASCWEEILEHAASTSISVKTTNVGPIGLPERRPSRQEVG